MHKRTFLLRWGFTTKDEGETIHLHMPPKRHPISSQLQGCHRSAAGPKLTTLLRTSAMGLKEYFQIQILGLGPPKKEGQIQLQLVVGSAVVVFFLGCWWVLVVWPIDTSYPGQMEHDELEPNAVTFTTAIGACERSQRWELALDFFRRLKASQDRDSKG